MDARQIEGRTALGLLQSAMDAIIACDAGGRVVLFNPSAERLFQHRADRVLGKPMDVLLPERFRSGHSGWMKAFAESPEGHRRMRGPGIIFALRADGSECPIEASISHLPDVEGSLFVAVLRDVSEKMASEAELRRLNTNLERLVEERTKALESALVEARQAGEAKTRFLSTISHELRTPLHNILGFAALLAEDDDSAASGRCYAEKIIKHGRTLITLIDDLLDSAKIQAGTFQVRPERIDLVAVVDELLEEFDPILATSGVAIRKSCPRHAAYRGDSFRLSQALRNILANAIRYSPPKSEIELALDQSPTGFTVVIADQGHGIPESELQSVFGQFTQSSLTRSKDGGTGLGLPIARGIVEAHGGNIHAENNSPTGARFVIALPHVNAEPPPQA